MIETERLTLRQMTIDDIEELLLIFSDPRAMKYFNVIFDRSRMETWVRDNLEHQARHGFSLLAVVLKETGEVIGDCGLETTIIDGEEVIGIGYDFRYEYWNQGYATEAALAVRDYGFRHYGFKEICCWIDPENVASQRVAEKIGMTRVRTVLRGDKTYALYSIQNPQ